MAEHISIIICTRNRAESLRATLHGLAAVDIPVGCLVELLLIDNGSTDQTANVFHSAELPGLSKKYIREDQPGLCFARNRALKESGGEILLWTDDDVQVPGTWISDMCGPIIAGTADAVSGGIIFPKHIERVLSREPFASRRGWFASHEHLSAESPRAMIGANMAFHRRVLAVVPMFDIELGSGALGFWDEFLFSMQLKEAGFRLKSNFECLIEHHFDIQRVTSSMLIQTARKMGRSYAFVYYHWEHYYYHFASARLLYAWIRLTAARIWDRIRVPNSIGVSTRRLWLEETVAFRREYLLQSSRKHKYSVRGFRPLVD